MNALLLINDNFAQSIKQKHCINRKCYINADDIYTSCEYSEKLQVVFIRLSVMFFCTIKFNIVSIMIKCNYLEKKLK